MFYRWLNCIQDSNSGNDLIIRMVYKIRNQPKWQVIVKISKRSKIHEKHQF